MKLIALLLGLALEHVATRRLGLRELRGLDPYFDLALALARQRTAAVATMVLLVFALIATAPVLWVAHVLDETFVPWELPYLLFSIGVLLVALGPRDLGSEVDEYCAALHGGDTATATRVLTELSESHHAGPRDVDAVEEAIFVQATNRVFAVVFWFVALGPVGAWLVRVVDLLRRRAAFESSRDSDFLRSALPAAELLHGLLGWAPARLASLGYALAGSFDDALNAWRAYRKPAARPFYANSERLVAVVGKAAMTGVLERPTNSSAAARNAMRLVMRTLFIWITVVALMTLFGWAV